MMKSRRASLIKEYVVKLCREYSPWGFPDFHYTLGMGILTGLKKDKYDILNVCCSGVKLKTKTFIRADIRKSVMKKLFGDLLFVTIIIMVAINVLFN